MAQFISIWPADPAADPGYCLRIRKALDAITFDDSIGLGSKALLVAGPDTFVPPLAVQIVREFVLIASCAMEYT